MVDCTAIFDGGVRDLGYMKIGPSSRLTQEIMTHRSVVATRANALYHASCTMLFSRICLLTHGAQ